MDSKSSHRINLTQYRRVNGKWQFVPIVKANGKPDPRLVLVGGEPTSYKGGGNFFLDWREGGRNGRRLRKSVGNSPRAALDEWYRATGITNGSLEPEPEPSTEETLKSLSVNDAIEQYLKTVKATKGAATHQAYCTDLNWAKKHLSRSIVARIDRTDLINIFASGREAGLNQKTINKRVTVMLQMIRHAGHDVKLRKGDWPKTVDKQIEVYTPDELRRFFAACTDEERLLFQTFLLSGFRDEEVSHLAWRDVHYSIGKLSVSAKPQLGFTPKSYEVRGVEVPSGLLAAFKKRQKMSKSDLVFPAPPHPTRPNYGGDGVDAHMLDTCKEIAFRAGLNCGRCEGTYTVKRSATKKEKLHYSCRTHPRCSNWYLHKWRHTFASNMLPVLGLKKLQLVLGHKDIATTQKYLHLVNEEEVRTKVERSTLAAYI